MFDSNLFTLLLGSLCAGGLGSFIISTSIIAEIRSTQRDILKLEKELEHIKLKIAALHAEFYKIGE